MTTQIPRRKILVGKRGRKKKDIDLVEIYRLIDQGKTLREIAADIGVSESTIRRRHLEEQERIPEPVDPWIEELFNSKVPDLDLPAEDEPWPVLESMKDFPEPPRAESDQDCNTESGPKYIGKFKKFSKL